VPDASGTEAYDVDALGNLVVGLYWDKAAMEHGLLDNGISFSNIDVPGATGTAALGITAPNQIYIVGYYFDPNGVRHGFLENDGFYYTIDAPGASNTEIYGINTVLQIVGTNYIGPGTVGTCSWGFLAVP